MKLLGGLDLFFFFNDTATTEIYTLSLHDALPIWSERSMLQPEMQVEIASGGFNKVDHASGDWGGDRKSTRLNSSHSQISYAVFCLKKKNNRESAMHTLIHRTSWQTRRPNDRCTST